MEADQTTARLFLRRLILAAIAAAVIIWFFPRLEAYGWGGFRFNNHHELDLMKLENEHRKTWAQIAIAGFGLFILYFTWRRAEAGEKTVRIMEQGHITDRFTKAIEQLGKMDGDNPNIEVRLGAIYALERIAIDSPRDHWTIMEILTAYVRQNSPLGPPQPPEMDKAAPFPKRRTDFQAILTVLGRRKTGPEREGVGLRIDLSKSDLSKLDLHGANLSGSRLVYVNLQETDLNSATLEGAQLMYSLLRVGRLGDANLRGANLAGANLQNAHLVGASLQKAFLVAADLQGADLNKANLEGAFLAGANLSGTNLFGAEGLTAQQVKSAKAWVVGQFAFPHARFSIAYDGIMSA